MLQTPIAGPPISGRLNRATDAERYALPRRLYEEESIRCEFRILTRSTLDSVFCRDNVSSTVFPHCRLILPSDIDRAFTTWYMPETGFPGKADPRSHWFNILVGKLWSRVVQYLQSCRYSVCKGFRVIYWFYLNSTRKTR